MPAEEGLEEGSIPASDETLAVCHSHKERHFAGAAVVHDLILGLSDGLTVPFALAAGLSALGSSRLVLIAGAAEIVAGSISMGLGGWLAGLSDIQHYEAERAREAQEIIDVPLAEEEEVYDVFKAYGIDRAALKPLVTKLKASPEKWIDFMMQFELGLEKPNSRQSWISALTIGGAYFVGGLVPLSPYIFISKVGTALWVSVGVTVFALLVFGFVKSVVLGIRSPWRGALQTAFIGAIASGAAYGIAKALPSPTA